MPEHDGEGIDDESAVSIVAWLGGGPGEPCAGQLVGFGVSLVEMQCGSRSIDVVMSIVLHQCI